MFDYLKTLRTLPKTLEKMMADIAQIQADVAALKDAEAAAADELEQLANTVNELRQAGAENVTPAQLDQLHDDLQSVTSGLRAATEQADTSTQVP